MYKIIKKVTLNKDVDLMEIEAPFVSKNAQPGHFLIIRIDEQGERIPLTIVDNTDTTVTIIFQKLGYSTNLLSKLNVGDFLSDVVGPLGKPSHIREVKRVLGVAGGVGAAPLYPQLKEYAKRGVKVDLVIGGRTKDHLLLVDEYKEFCDNIYYATDDGSKGTKGFATDAIMKIVNDGNEYDHSVVIGPLIMMKNTVMLLDRLQIPSDVSLNPIMIDGTGMCGNCRVSINDETFFACVDGPDFPSKGINFDELMTRQDYYKKEEHICNLKLVK